MKKYKKLLKRILIGIALLAVIQVGFFLKATASPKWKYAKRTFTCTGANYDLRYCVDLPASSRQDFSKTSWKPMPCINTATSFYNDKLRAGNCNKFMSNPGRWGFHEVSAKDAVPGDLMLFVRKKDGARHAGIYTMDSLLGPLCANTVVKGRFVHFLPVKPLLAVHAIGFYKVKYYRYSNV